MGILIKKAAESRLYNFDFTDLLATGETVTDSPAPTVTFLPDDSILVVGSPSVTSPFVQVQLSDGVEDQTYTAQTVATTSLGNILVVDGSLMVVNALTIAALDRLRTDVQASVCPTLADEELLAILNRPGIRRASIWKASQSYQIGDVVIPTSPNRNGHRFQVKAFMNTGTDQLSDATEPSWSITRDAQITDNHVIWQEAGWDYDAVLWDLTAAARAGWEEKAGKASSTSDWQQGDMRVSSSQLFEHCQAMARQFQRSYVL